MKEYRNTDFPTSTHTTNLVKKGCRNANSETNISKFKHISLINVNLKVILPESVSVLIIIRLKWRKAFAAYFN